MHLAHSRPRSCIHQFPWPTPNFRKFDGWALLPGRAKSKAKAKPKAKAEDKGIAVKLEGKNWEQKKTLMCGNLTSG